MTENTIALVACLEQFGYVVQFCRRGGAIGVCASPAGGGAAQYGICLDGDGVDEQERAIEVLAYSLSLDWPGEVEEWDDEEY